MGGSVGVITAYRAGARREQRGFSLIELLVTVTLAGIIFVAMVPMFVSVLKGTSTSERRVIATNLSQARLEDARMLGYANLSATSLQSNFGTTFTAAHGGAIYNISYAVTSGPTSSATPTPAYKQVTVSISRAGQSFPTVTTIVQNPAVLSTAAYSSMGGGGGPYSITAAFKDATEVKSPGVYVVQYWMNATATPTPTPTKTVTLSPSLMPAAIKTATVLFTNIPGGTAYEYSVFCNSKDWTGALYTPPFHLLNNGWVKFDTNPGGS